VFQVFDCHAASSKIGVSIQVIAISILTEGSTGDIET
jgi:hypothetical protein